MIPRPYRRSWHLGFLFFLPEPNAIAKRERKLYDGCRLEGLEDKKVQESSAQRTWLAIYKLTDTKPGAKPFEGIIDEDSVEYHDLDASVPGAEAKIFVKEVSPHAPSWAPFLTELSDEVSDVLTESTANSAVLALLVGRSRYAITFGYGRSMLAPGAVVRGFGLRCALELIDPESLVSVAYKEIDYRTLLMNVQASANMKFGEFRVDTEAAIMGGVVGHVRPPQNYYTRAFGSDALHINPKISATRLSGLVKWIDQVYAAKGYINRGYDWIDHVAIVNDTSEIARLEAMLDMELSKNPKAVWLAPPETLDYGKIEDFTIQGARGDRVAEVTLSAFAKARGVSPVTVSDLKKARIRAMQGDEVRGSWRAFDWANWSERSSGGPTHILHQGRFYSVDPSFERKIDAWLKKLPGLPSDWPDWPNANDATEAVYNDLLWKHLERNHVTGAVVFDKKPFTKSFRGHGSLELCDVMVKEQPPILVCVKKYDGSSAPLSHLFAQGLNSLETLLSDGTFRDEVRHFDSEMSTYVPDANSPPGRYVLAYLVLAKPDRKKRKALASLPFFAKLTLYRSAKAALARGMLVWAGTRIWTS